MDRGGFVARSRFEVRGLCLWRTPLDVWGGSGWAIGSAKPYGSLHQDTRGPLPRGKSRSVDLGGRDLASLPRDRFAARQIRSRWLGNNKMTKQRQFLITTTK